MKFSQQTLLKFKKKNKKLRPNIYRKLKRASSRGLIKGTSEKPRLSVYKSNQNLYAQIIDDTKEITLIFCTTNQREIKLRVSNGRTCEAAEILGKEIAKLSLKKKITQVVFDRGPYLYHGRIKAIASGARIGGLSF